MAMVGAGTTASENRKFTAINPDAFKDGFSVDVLLTFLARDEVKQKLSSRAQLEGGTAPLVAKASLERVARLVGTMERAEEELQRLHTEIGRQVTHLKSAMKKQEGAYQTGIDSAEDVGDQVRLAFKDVEGAANRISQVGLRIGDRLQTADAVRSRALELVSLLSHLYAFSQLDAPTPEKDAEAQFRKGLPAVFWEDKQLSEAAGLACKLTALTAEAHNAKQRSRLVNNEEWDSPGIFGNKGSLNWTTWQLAGYCNWLEIRVVTRFDRGFAKGSTRIMSECAAIMAQFKAERMLIQRYLESLPVFHDDDDSGSVPHVPPPAGPTAQHMSAALQPFYTLCDLLQATFEAEVHRLSEVFSNGTQALELFIHKLCSDRLAPALRNLLVPPEMDSQAAKDQAASARRTDPSTGATNAAAGDSKGANGNGEETGSETDNEGESESGDEEESEEDEESEGDSDKTMSDHFAEALTQPSGSEGGQGADTRRKAVWGGKKAPAIAESPELLALRLKLLNQVHARVMEMSEALETAALLTGVRTVNLSALRDRLFAPYLSNYPHPELRWLDLTYKVALSKQSHPQVDLLTGKLFINNSKESLARAAALSRGNQDVCAAHVRMLFYGAGPFGELPGGLLEQLSQYIINGIEHTFKLADIEDPGARAKAEVAAHCEAEAHFIAQTQAAAAAAAEAAGRQRRPDDPPLPQPPTPPPPVTKQQAVDRAAHFANTKLKLPLQAVHTSVSIMTVLQDHYTSHVEPCVAPVVGELSQCSQGLMVLIKAVEESISMLLQRLVDVVVIQAEVSLIIHQKREDFAPSSLYTPLASPAAQKSQPGSLQRPPNTPQSAGQRPGQGAAAATGALGRPTEACMVVCALLRAMQRVVGDLLEGANLTAFMQEVGLRVHALLINHMQQYRYNAAGALRWKCDITEYVDVIRAWDVPGLRDKLLEVQALANILVVPPESLLGLVDAALRLDHREALKFVALRQDFETASVDGRSIKDLFSSGNTVDAIISQASHRA